jgi:hypothetical protein
MQDVQVAAAGGVILWNCGPTRRELLGSRLEALGHGGFKPPEKTDEAALSAALKDHCDSANRVVRRLGRDKIVQRKKTRKDGFEVVDVKRSQHGANTYTLDFSVYANGNGPTLLEGYTDIAQIREWFAEHKATLTGAAVGQALVKLMAYFGSVALREAGGLYWLPPDAMAHWIPIAEAVEESAAEKGKTTVYCLTTEMTGETIRCVKDSVVVEVNAATDTLLEEVVGGMGEEALKRRKAVAAELHRKVSMYEGYLSTSLDDLHSSLAKVEELITQMTLQSMGV